MKDDTLMVHAGRDPEAQMGCVNQPVYRASTVIYGSMDRFKNRVENRYHGFGYGAMGTPNAFELGKAVARLEGGHDGVVTSTGQSAVNLAITAFVDQGDHLLICDSVYSPARNYVDNFLSRFGVEATYYPPTMGEEIGDLIQDNTKVVFTESPGSLTFEVQDIPAIAKAAHKRGCVVLMDNTWGTPLHFKSFNHGVDVSIQAGTKYIAGHSDVVVGMISAADEELYRKVRDTTLIMGEVASPEVCFLSMRGLRSMGARMRQQMEAGLKVAKWMRSRPEVKRVLYPPLPDDPGHEIWKRDFTGGASLFGVILNTDNEDAVAAMVDNYRYFGLGASWGGFESLVLPAFPAKTRSATNWDEEGYLLRYHIGLEDTDELIEDLEQGFTNLNRALAG